MQEHHERAVFAQLFSEKLSKGDQTKVRIIRSAIDHIAKKGIESFTFEAVGEPIGLNRAQVKYHFAEKEELIDKSVTYLVATLQSFIVEELEKVTGWRDRVDAILDAEFRWLDAHPEQGSLWLYFAYSATVHPRHRKLLRDMQVIGVRRMSTVLAQSGKWKGKKAESLAYHVWTTIDGFILYHLIMKHLPKGFLHGEAKRAVGRLLDG